jgi:nucleotide-binding universal stress UspA family protein
LRISQGDIRGIWFPAFAAAASPRYGPDRAILLEAGRGYDLAVLGVSQRPGDMLFFGNSAAAVFERSPTSILFVAS